MYPPKRWSSNLSLSARTDNGCTSLSVIKLKASTGDASSAAGNTFFISDLHLDPKQQDTVELSLRFFAYAKGAQALFIIGDLFEYWLGDDGADPQLKPVYDAISAVSQSGTDVHLMHGNRDFLLGEQFAAQVGATLHRADHVQVDFGSAQFSLLHGDTLCTDDVDYQRLRTMVRDRQWQADFLGLSISERIAQAQALREKSREAVASKQVGIMDVNGDAVLAHFSQFANNTLIHGHTHRPYDHTPMNEKPGSSVNNPAVEQRRVVLGDWKPDHAMIARFDGTSLLFEQFG